MATGGQIYPLLCRSTLRFMALNAFEASTSGMASVLSYSNKLFIAYTAASHPAFWPAHNFRDPALLIMSV